MPYKPPDPPMFGKLLAWRPGRPQILLPDGSSALYVATYNRAGFRLIHLAPKELESVYGYSYDRSHWAVVQEYGQVATYFMARFPLGFALLPDLDDSKIMAELLITCPWYEPGINPPIHDVIMGKSVLHATPDGLACASLIEPNVVGIFRSCVRIATIRIVVRIREITCKPIDTAWVLTKLGKETVHSTWPEAYYQAVREDS